MRQLLNAEYVAEMEAVSHDDSALVKWRGELERPPAGVRGRNVSIVSDDVAFWMGQA